MEAKIIKNLMHIKYRWNLMTFKIGVLGQAYNPDYTSRSMRLARPDI